MAFLSCSNKHLDNSSIVSDYAVSKQAKTILKLLLQGWFSVIYTEYALIHTRTRIRKYILTHFSVSTKTRKLHGSVKQHFLVIFFFWSKYKINIH